MPVSKQMALPAKYFFAPHAKWGPECAHRVWKLHAPAYILNDLPAALHRTLQRYLLKSADSLAPVSRGFRLRRLARALIPFFVKVVVRYVPMQAILMTSLGAVNRMYC